MLSLLLLLLAAPPADEAALIAVAHDRTSAERRCVYDTDTTDITVCGLRHADRFRVPLVVHDPDDRRYRGVPAERAALIRRSTPLEEHSPFLVGGGMAGVHATTALGGDGGGGTTVEGLRTPAP